MADVPWPANSGPNEQASEAESLLASAADLANTYARMHGVEEAASPEEIKGVIKRLAWKASQRDGQGEEWAQHLQDTYDEGKAAALDDAIPVKVTTFWQRTDGRAQVLAIADEPVERGEYYLVKPPMPDPTCVESLAR